jgi:glucose-1-phosphate cytidylyltransferase
MKVVILAGGFGARIEEKTEVKPKPIVEIGGQAILRPIMNVYAAHDYKEFIVSIHPARRLTIYN